MRWITVCICGVLMSLHYIVCPLMVYPCHIVSWCNSCQILQSCTPFAFFFLFIWERAHILEVTLEPGVWWRCDSGRSAMGQFSHHLLTPGFMTCMAFYLLWITKVDALKNVLHKLYYNYIILYIINYIGTKGCKAQKGWKISKMFKQLNTINK